MRVLLPGRAPQLIRSAALTQGRVVAVYLYEVCLSNVRHFMLAGANMKYRRIVFALVLVMCACGSDNGHSAIQASTGVAQTAAAELLQRDMTKSFQTDTLTVTLVSTTEGLTGDIAYSFANHTAQPVYIVNCNGATDLRLEKQVNAQWVTAWGPAVPACLSPPIIVQPEHTYRDVVEVFSGHPTNNLYPKFSVDDVPGVYRLVWRDVLHTFDPNTYPFGEALPLDKRISNMFYLQVE